MRSTSTSSSPAARGLFRLLVGAGLVRLVWKEFWKWALPKPRRSFLADVFLREAYLTTIQSQLNMRRPLLWSLQKPQTIDEYVGEALEFDLPHERWVWKFKLWWSNNRPIITTPKRQDEKYYD